MSSLVLLLKGVQMKARVALVALAAAVTLTSVAAAGPDAAKQRVVITSQASQTTKVSPFVLTPLQAGALKPDSGTQTAGSSSGRTVMREGQRVEIYDGVGTLKGNRGSLVVHLRTEYVDGGNGYHVGTGTWKVVRGTGQYAQITGGGRTGTVVLDRGPWSSRSEGFLTLP
jgi:hypothetical protein